MYVANSLSGTVSVIDAATNRVTNTIKLGGGFSPTAVLAASNGYVYVADGGEPAVAVIAGGNLINTITEGFPSGVVGITGLANGSSGSVYAVTSYSQNIYIEDSSDGVLFESWVAQKSVVSEIIGGAVVSNTEVGYQAVGVASNGSGTAWVTNTYPASYVNWNDEDGQEYVSCSNSSPSSCSFPTSLTGSVSKINNGEVIYTYTQGIETPVGVVFSSTYGPIVSFVEFGPPFVAAIAEGGVQSSVETSIPLNTYGMVLSPNGSYLYIADPYNSSVSVVTLANWKVTSTITVGEGPVGVAVSSNGQYLYVTNNADNTVSVINTTTNTETARIKVGEGPQGIAVA